jgi:hypothetical protein
MGVSAARYEKITIDPVAHGDHRFRDPGEAASITPPSSIHGWPAVVDHAATRLQPPQVDAAVAICGRPPDLAHLVRTRSAVDGVEGLAQVVGETSSAASV